MYNFGIVGNCQINALVSKMGSVEWLCMPRPDSPPCFGSLLDEDDGCFSVDVFKCTSSTQHYRKQSTILETTLKNDTHQEVRITDFCPRFEQHGRMYRPASLIRIVESVGEPLKVRICCRPVDGWSKRTPTMRRGNSHLRFSLRDGELRIVTNMSLTHLVDESYFTLHEPLFFAVLWDQDFEADLKETALDFLQKTEHYWRAWVKHGVVPTLFQDEVIRSALTLKLHCYEDTGAILAATSTSLPEISGGERNWDNRLCWLRDACFVLSAFRNLGHYEEMEGFLKFLLNVADFEKPLAPVYTLDHKISLPENIIGRWRGHKGAWPVREMNAAASQLQCDVYGELLLALSPIYWDERFEHLRTRQLAASMEWLVARCMDSIGLPDAGQWEIRGMIQERAFANLSSWAGLNRVRKLLEAQKFQTPKLTLDVISRYEKKAYERVLASGKEGIIYNGPDDPTLDSSLLLAAVLRFPNLESVFKTVQAIAERVRFSEKHPSFLYRYLRCDDYGHPKSAFVICSFWLAEALFCLGRQDDGLKVMQEGLRSANEVGLLAEHFDPKSHTQMGNFPQAYSHVGLINAAFKISPSWSEII